MSTNSPLHAERSVPATAPREQASPRRPFRTVDLLVSVMIGVAFGVVFLGYGVLYSALTPAIAAFPPAQALLGGLWLLPGIVAGLVVRRPGAAFLALMVAAVLSYLLGGQWAWLTFFSGLLQGAGVEAGFALFRYRRFGALAAMAAGFLGGLLEAGFELLVYFRAWSLPFQVAFGIGYPVCAAVGGGLLALALVRALAGTGALRAFPAGREHAQRTAA
jgi:energy-coupling factor transport system permease protein